MKRLLVRRDNRPSRKKEIKVELHNILDLASFYASDKADVNKKDRNVMK